MKQLLTAPLAALLLTLTLTACGGAPAQPAIAPPAEPPSSSASESQRPEASLAAPVLPSPDSQAPEAAPAPESVSPGAALPVAGPASSDAGPGDNESQAQAVGLCEIYVACDHLGTVEEVLDADVELFEGDTVWDLLARSGAEHHVSAIKTGSGESLRVKAIGGVWEEAHGEDSRWVYSVNGWYPDKGCGVYFPKDGDIIRWEYLNPGRETDD